MIEPMVVSDHHPITLTLQFPDQIPFTKAWKLDSSLLTDARNPFCIRNSLQNYFKENGTPEMALLTQWEMHKCVLRGTFLALSAAWKKAAQA